MTTSGELLPCCQHSKGMLSELIFWSALIATLDKPPACLHCLAVCLHKLLNQHPAPLNSTQSVPLSLLCPLHTLNLVHPNATQLPAVAAAPGPCCLPSLLSGGEPVHLCTPLCKDSTTQLQAPAATPGSCGPRPAPTSCTVPVMAEALLSLLCCSRCIACWTSPRCVCGATQLPALAAAPGSCCPRPAPSD